MKVNLDVRNTAIEYFKRFYLKQSVYDFSPLDMMFAAIYLAIKVEETNFRLSEFITVNPDCKRDKLVQMESFLIKGLKFQFFVYSPYRCFDGFCSIIKHKVDELNVPNLAEKIDEIEELGNKAIKFLHYTDCGFLFPPAEIGFAAFGFA